MVSLEIVPLTTSHVEWLAPRIREADRAELWAASHRTDMHKALRDGLDLSVEAFAGLAGGEPFCAFGVSCLSLLDRHGSPWMLGTRKVEEHALGFLRASRSVISVWSEEWTLLENHVDARNLRSVTWLKWLGFRVEDARPFGAEGLPFHRFSMGVDRV